MVEIYVQQDISVYKSQRQSRIALWVHSTLLLVSLQKQTATIVLVGPIVMNWDSQLLKETV